MDAAVYATALSVIVVIGLLTGSGAAVYARLVKTAGLWTKTVSLAGFCLAFAGLCAFAFIYLEGQSALSQAAGLRAQAKLDESMDKYAEALGIFDAVYYATGRAQALTGMGDVLHEKGDYEGAIDYYERAGKSYVDSMNTRSPEFATLLNNTGENARRLGRYATAIKHYSEALSVIEAMGGEDDALSVTVLNNLGLAHAGTGDSAAAIEYYKKALDLCIELYGPDHHKVGINLNNIGLAYADIGEHEKAVEYYEKALILKKKYFGPEHPSVATTINNIGLSLRKAGRLDEAAGNYAQALEILIKSLGGDRIIKKSKTDGEYRRRGIEFRLKGFPQQDSRFCFWFFHYVKSFQNIELFNKLIKNPVTKQQGLRELRV